MKALFVWLKDWLADFISAPWDEMKKKPLFWVLAAVVGVPFLLMVWGVLIMLNKIFRNHNDRAIAFLSDYECDDLDTIEPPKMAFNFNWICIPCILAALWMMINMWSNNWLGFLFLAGFIAHIISGSISVDYPYILVVYIFGIPCGQIGPGWYFVLKPFIWVEKIDTRERLITIKCPTMFTKTGTPINAEVLLSIRIFDGMKFQRINNVPDPISVEEAKITNDENWSKLPPLEKKAALSAMSAFRTLTGKQKFLKVNSSQDEFQKAASEDINKYLHRVGALVSQFEIFNIDEAVESKAAAIKVVGKAEAEMEGLKAKKVKEGFEGGTWKSAAVVFANAFAKKYLKDKG